MSKVKFNDDGTILIKDVRLSYPHLFQMFGKEDGKKKYSCRVILPNKTHKAEIEAIKAHLVKLQKDWFKQKLPSTNLFMRNGDDLGQEEYEDTWYIAASEKIKPQVVGKKREPISEDDDIVYGGCYVNLLIRPWKQSNEHGKKVNANLIGVQFVRDGERFGQQRPDINEHFSDEGVDEDFDESGDDGFGDED